MNTDILKQNWEEMQQEGYMSRMGLPESWLDIDRVEPIKVVCEVSKLRRRLILERSITLNESMRVAVIGSGFGLDEEWLFPYVKSIVGCDISPKAVAIARKRFAEIDKVTFVEVDGKDLSIYKSDSFDLIFSITVFQHIPREMARMYFEEFSRMLKVGGKSFVQFLSGKAFNRLDATVEKKAPSVGYSLTQLEELTSGLPMKMVFHETDKINDNCDWIWATHERMDR